LFPHLELELHIFDLLLLSFCTLLEQAASHEGVLGVCAIAVVGAGRWHLVCGIGTDDFGGTCVALYHWG
jgi:hypothetical protein